MVLRAPEEWEHLVWHTLRSVERRDERPGVALGILCTMIEDGQSLVSLDAARRGILASLEIPANRQAAITLPVKRQ